MLALATPYLLAHSVQFRTVSSVFVNEICTLNFSGANTSACVTIEYWSWYWTWSPTLVLSYSKPQNLISNQLSGITAINHTLWNTICSFPTLFLSDFSYLKLNLSYFSWFSLRDIQKQHRGKKKIAKNTITDTLTVRSFVHTHKEERAVNLSLGRSLINIYLESWLSTIQTVNQPLEQ